MEDKLKPEIGSQIDKMVASIKQVWKSSAESRKEE